MGVTDKFSVGEIALLVRGSGGWSRGAAMYIGTEVTVIGPRIYRGDHQTGGISSNEPRYVVKTFDGLTDIACLEDALRKIPPKCEEFGHWAEVERILKWKRPKTERRVDDEEKILEYYNEVERKEKQ